MSEPTKRVRRTGLMKRSGPYKVTSFTDGTMKIEPAWNVPGEDGIMARMALAGHIEDFLNVGTTPK